MIPFQKLNLSTRIVLHSPMGFNSMTIKQYQLGTWKTHDDDNDNDAVYLYYDNV